MNRTGLRSDGATEAAAQADAAKRMETMRRLASPAYAPDAAWRTSSARPQSAPPERRNVSGVK